MTAALRAFTGAVIFDGTELHRDSALLVRGASVERIVPAGAIPDDADRHGLNDGILAPGFVDLQVNGGGGVMFNDDQSVDTLQTMAQAHARIGATSILPTLITDTPGITRNAIEAACKAVETGVAGIEGLHLEGPHLSISRKGAHDPDLIRPMEDSDLGMLLDAARRLPVLKVTVAPENVSLDQMRRLADAGIIVSLGHTDASHAACLAAAGAGARCVTHLFNAMSQLGNREPGLVGAALGTGTLSAGMIADLIHVHPETIAASLRAKCGPGQIFLVSDAMATAGSEISGFTLNGRWITRAGDRLTLESGTLAGAHLELATAVRNMVDTVGLPTGQALAMATSIPARIIGREGRIGTLASGARANLLHLTDGFDLRDVWRDGVRIV